MYAREHTDENPAPDDGADQSPSGTDPDVAVGAADPGTTDVSPGLSSQEPRRQAVSMGRFEASDADSGSAEVAGSALCPIVRESYLRSSATKLLDSGGYIPIIRPYGGGFCGGSS